MLLLCLFEVFLAFFVLLRRKVRVVGGACIVLDINIDYLMLIIGLVFSFRRRNSLLIINFSGIFCIRLVNCLKLHYSITYLNCLFSQFLIVFKHFVKVVLQNKVRNADQVVSVLSKAYDGLDEVDSLRS